MKRCPRDSVGASAISVHPQVLADIEEACLAAGDHETGGPLLGRVERSWNGERLVEQISVLSTVAPGSDVDGRPAAVTLGGAEHGERAAAIARWWGKVTGVRLQHLGDWHLHPSGVAEPSSGDHRTAHDMLSSSATGVWLVGIALAQVESETRQGTNKHRWSSSEVLRTEVQLGMFNTTDKKLEPCRFAPDEKLITMPPLPWHLLDGERLALEVRLLRAQGRQVFVAPPMPGVAAGPTLRIDAEGCPSLVIGTPLSFPREPPAILLGEHSRTPRWSGRRYLADIVAEES